jgi:hypothetical protein
MLLPSIPVSHQALVRASCDGAGLITLPTEDGPEHFACDGCRSCTTAAEAPSRHRARLAADPFHNIPVTDDELW